MSKTSNLQIMAAYMTRTYGHVDDWGPNFVCPFDSLPLPFRHQYWRYISLCKCFTEHCSWKCWTLCSVQYCLVFCWSNIDIPGSYCHNPTFPYHLKQKPNFLQFYKLESPLKAPLDSISALDEEQTLFCALPQLSTLPVLAHHSARPKTAT